jgi:hypothetical protein
MVHPHPTLYRVLGLVFLAITLVLIFIGVALNWPLATRTALFIFSFFPLLLALVYVYLGIQEERGF